MIERWPLAALALVVGCSGGDASPSSSTDGAPYVTATSDSGRLVLEVRTTPQPPSRGEVALQLTVRDAATGAPRSGLAVTMIPWMAAMGHGTSVTPDVVETSPGVYSASRLELFMPGTWELRTDLAAADATDHAVPKLQIP